MHFWFWRRPSVDLTVCGQEYKNAEIVSVIFNKSPEVVKSPPDDPCM